MTHNSFQLSGLRHFEKQARFLENWASSLEADVPILTQYAMHAMPLAIEETAVESPEGNHATMLALHKGSNAPA
jgi:hypothetical protein